MDTFEKYATRVIAGLSAPDEIDAGLFNSPLEEAFSDLTGQLIEIDPTEWESDLRTLNGSVSAEDEESIENGVLASGLEALAFYKSIHHKAMRPFNGKWGIFIFDHALNYLASEIEDFYSGKYLLAERLEKALLFLYFHERFHFRFDCWSISQESASGLPLYENYRNSIYRTFHPDKLVCEESLANLHALSSIARHGVYEYSKQFMLCQPGAYSNIRSIIRDKFRAKLAAQLFFGFGWLTATPASDLPEHSQYLAHPHRADDLDKQCPVYIVQGVSASRFVKPGISLPSRLEIERKYLKKYLSGREKRADHKYFVIDNGEKIKCPNPHYKHVKLHEFKNIVRKSGLTTAEYFEERQSTNRWKKNVPRVNPKPSLIQGTV